MSERIDNLNTADLAVVNYFDRISRKLDVTLEVDGSSIVIDGDDGLKRLRARECIEALVMFAQKEDIDARFVDYVIYLASCGKIEEFISMGDEVFYMTPTGRPVKAKTLGQQF